MCGGGGRGETHCYMDDRGRLRECSGLPKEMLWSQEQVLLALPQRKDKDKNYKECQEPCPLILSSENGHESSWASSGVWWYCPLWFLPSLEN